MAIFKFRLASVLRFREHVKEEKQWELISLYEERQRLETAIAILQQELMQSGETMAVPEGQIFTAMELRLHGHFSIQATEQLKHRRAALANIDQKIAAKRSELVEAMRGVKTLERFRERLAARFWRRQDNDEQKFTDEIGQRNYAKVKSRQKLP